MELGYMCYSSIHFHLHSSWSSLGFNTASQTSQVVIAGDDCHILHLNMDLCMQINLFCYFLRSSIAIFLELVTTLQAHIAYSALNHSLSMMV